MDSDTHLTLSEWAKILGMHPVHFAQINFNAGACNQILFEYAWQNSDSVGRYEIAEAINEAETLIERELNHFLTPTPVVGETFPSPRYFRPEYFADPYNVRGQSFAIQTKWGEVITGGKRVTADIEDGASIVYSDSDGDGYEETATITATVASGQAEDEVKIYIPDTLREVRPATVSISGTTATITTQRELLVKRSLYEALAPTGIDGEDDSNFYATVDVKRVYTDPQDQATLMYEPIPGCGSCNGTGCEACAHEVKTGCLLIKDPRTGIVGVVRADWDADEEHFDFKHDKARRPDRVRINYISGIEYTQAWKRAVAYFAASMLDRPPCSCSTAAWSRWREDLAVLEGGEDQTATYALSDSDLSNPFGTKRGAIQAWKRVYDQRIAESAVLI